MRAQNAKLIKKVTARIAALARKKGWTMEQAKQYLLTIAKSEESKDPDGV